ncbi:MAG: [LysW]-aminoadipate kinase [Anaerolineae bacterium]|nr:[LysW]-aminoadipate kinase [Anaerolineae bacterium]
MIRVLKLGGNAEIDQEPVLRNLASRIAQGERWVLVHGASGAANALAEQVGYRVQTITSPGGHTSRYTDARMIELYSAAAAVVNQRIAARLAAYDVSAVGLAGPNVIVARRKTAIRALRNGRPVVIRDDYSGTITGIDAGMINTLLDNGYTPVIAPVAMGEAFERLNVDGDLVAATITRALEASTLIILSNVPGLLRDVNDPGSLVHQFMLSEVDVYNSLAQGRMKKKLLAAREAYTERVILAGANGENPLDAALNGSGTHITNTQPVRTSVVDEVHYAEYIA